MATSPCRTAMQEFVAMGVTSDSKSGWSGWSNTCNKGSDAQYDYDPITWTPTLVKEAEDVSQYVKRVDLRDNGSIVVQLNMPELYYDKYNTTTEIVLTPYTILSNGQKGWIYNTGVHRPRDTAPHHIHGWICNVSTRWYSVNIKYLPSECVLTRENFSHVDDWADLNEGKLGKTPPKRR